MTLLEQQQMFTQHVGILIDEIIDKGYQVTLGEAYRTKEQAEWNAQHGSGISNSLHCQRLAIDLNIFDANDQLFATVDQYRPIGEFWKRLHPLNRWGGDFSKPDADHFSMEWQGVK